MASLDGSFLGLDRWLFWFFDVEQPSGFALPPTPNWGRESYLTASLAPTVDEDGPLISVNVAIGNPTWPRDWLQTKL